MGGSYLLDWIFNEWMLAWWRSKPIGMTPQEHQPITGSKHQFENPSETGSLRLGLGFLCGEMT